MLVKESVKTNSDGTIIKSIYNYAFDYNDNTFGSQWLRAKSMNDVVLETSQYLNDQIISKTVTNYADFDGIVKPASLQELSTSSMSLETKVNFNNYDYFGNIISMNKAFGPSTCYLYSYNGIYPIAEIKNASYSAIVNLLGASEISNFSKAYPSKLDIDNFLAPLKNSLVNAQIRSFAYKPAVGLISETDIKNMSIGYEYDGYQRLKTIKDGEGNIVKHLDYHYK